MPCSMPLEKLMQLSGTCRVGCGVQIITVSNQEDVKKAAPLPGLKYVWYAPNNPAPGSPAATAEGGFTALPLHRLHL